MTKAKVNGRGFRYIDFKDIYGAECSIQESSGSTPALWCGCEHETIHHVTGEHCGARMLLDKKLAIQLVNKLQQWIDTGVLK